MMTTRWKLDNAFLRKQVVYLNTAKTEWPYVNSASAVCWTCESVARRVERYRNALELLLQKPAMEADGQRAVVQAALSEDAEMKPWDKV